MTGVSVELETVTKSYGGAAAVISGLSLRVSPGEFVSVLGRSGIGKSTLLRMIAGLEQPDSGRILVDGKEVVEPPAQLGYIVQDYSQSLFPWLKVSSNLALALPRRRLTRDDISSRISAVLKSVKLPGVENRYPWELSGGMQQRVALARALLREPRLLLLDEPFASVDALVRMELEDLTRSLAIDNGVTTILITHDVDEAVYMADRVLVLAGKPACVCDEVRPGLPRLREHHITRSHQDFLSSRARVIRSVTSGESKQSP